METTSSTTTFTPSHNVSIVIPTDGLTFDLTSKKPQEICPLCGKSFAQRNFHLVVHLVIAHKLWHCSMCLTYFTNTEDRTIHEETKHATTKCSMCSDHLSAYDNSPGLHTHYMRKHSLKRCNFCDNMNLLRPGYYFKIHNKRRHKIVDEQLNTFQNFDGTQAIFEMTSNSDSDDCEFFCQLCRKNQLTVAMVAHFLTSHNLSVSLVLEQIANHAICMKFFLIDRRQDVIVSNDSQTANNHQQSPVKKVVRHHQHKSAKPLSMNGIIDDGKEILIKSNDMNANDEQIYCSKCLQNYSAVAPKTFHDIFCNGYFLCYKCGRTEKLLNHLYDHVTKEHNGATKCPFGCNITLRQGDEDTTIIGNPTDIQHHLLIRHQIMLCIFCDEIFRNESTFIQHLLHEHNAQSNANSLLIIVTGDKQIMNTSLCNFCKQTIDEPENLVDLLMHYKNVHKSNLSALLRMMTRIPMYTYKEKLSATPTTTDADPLTSIIINDNIICTVLTKQFSLIKNVLPFNGYRDFDPSLVECVVSSDEDSDDEERDQYPKQCEYCTRSATISKPKLSTRRQLVLMAHEHMAKHLFKLKPNKFRCCVCMKTLHAKNLGLYKHIQNMHNNITFETQKCPFCEDIFDRRSSLRKHICLHIDQHDYPCESKSLAFPCRYCHWRFWTVDDRNEHHMSRHSDIVDGDVLLCNICGKSYSCKTTYRRHTKFFHPQKTQIGPLLYRCTICHTCYATLDELRVHMTTGHPCNSRVYYRNSSGKIFDNVTKLLNFNNAQTVMSTQQHQCYYCWKICAQNDIESHVNVCKDHHPQQDAFNPNIFVCDICQFVFQNREDIESHMQQQHTTKRPTFQCDQCGILFKHFKNYYKHTLTHIQLHHKCTECLRVFGQKASLTQHQRTHEQIECIDLDNDDGWLKQQTIKINDFTCFCCGEEFQLESELIFHEKQHESPPVIQTVAVQSNDNKIIKSESVIKHEQSMEIMDDYNTKIKEQGQKGIMKNEIDLNDDTLAGKQEIIKQEQSMEIVDDYTPINEQQLKIVENAPINIEIDSDDDDKPLSRIKFEIKHDQPIELIDLAATISNSVDGYNNCQRAATDGDNLEQITFDMIEL